MTLFKMYQLLKALNEFKSKSVVISTYLSKSLLISFDFLEGKALGYFIPSFLTL